MAIQGWPGHRRRPGEVGVMTTDQIVGNMTSIRRRIRSIDTEYEGLENRVEAMNVVQAALREMTTLHSMLPKRLKEKSWVFLSLERGRTHYRSEGWR
jgi:hypothetical protein